MKYFINIVILGLIIMQINLNTQAQSLVFEYDAAGNMVKRAPSNCDANDIQIFAQPSSRSMTVNWDIYPGAVYILHYRKAGESNFTTYPATQPFVLLYGMESCTTYEFALKIECRNGSTSPLGNIFSFSTKGCRLAYDEATSLLQVSPNPATKHIQVELDSEQTVQQLSIYYSNGQLVQQLQPKAGKSTYQVELNDFASGVYFIKAHIGDEVLTEKFSVQ